MRGSMQQCHLWLSVCGWLMRSREDEIFMIDAPSAPSLRICKRWRLIISAICSVRIPRLTSSSSSSLGKIQASLILLSLVRRFWLARQYSIASSIFICFFTISRQISLFLGDLADYNHKSILFSQNFMSYTLGFLLISPHKIR